ncbi:MAG: class I SAM-dependent methyltransferase [Clostridia bacterium]|nr:class I SAM-dependent methyltransferase [Clostridia bacterium]
MIDKFNGRAYSALSPHYEHLVKGEEYEKWAEFVLNKIKTYSPTAVGADVACGSGYFTRAIKGKGYDVFGYDISDEMLSEARTLSAKRGQYIEFISGDLIRFKSFKKLGFITVINDGFNYIPPENIEKAFSAAYKNLVKGGLFLFDISSEYKLKNVIANNVFSVDEEDFTYIWFNSLCDGFVKMDLTFFEKEGNLYRRKDETHVQYIHKMSDIEDKLKSVGFDIKEISGINGEKVDEKSERICFIAVKK